MSWKLYTVNPSWWMRFALDETNNWLINNAKVQSEFRQYGKSWFIAAGKIPARWPNRTTFKMKPDIFMYSPLSLPDCELNGIRQPTEYSHIINPREKTKITFYLFLQKGFASVKLKCS